MLTGRQFLIFSFCLTAKERLFRISTVRIIHGWHCLSDKFIRVGDEDNSFCGDIVYSFDLLNGSVFSVSLRRLPNVEIVLCRVPESYLCVGVALQSLVKVCEQ